ncbi:MAG: PKD domain-containing protein, partial [Bacteroidota bacterium]
MMRLAILFGLIWSCSLSALFAQFSPIGTAFQTSADCYTLTPNTGGQAGAIWNTTQIDLNLPFDISAEIFLGCNNGGADGMTFAIQGAGLTALGTPGGSQAYSGITPSVAVEFDTWANATDPAADHTALISSGSVQHTPPTNLAGPVPCLPSAANVEDCMPHDIRITWDPVTDSFKVYFDCFLRIAYQGDIVANQFNGNSMVWWGFTAATGGATNLQTVCISPTTLAGSLTELTICEGDTIELMGGPGVSHAWTPAATLSDPNIPNPLAFPLVNTTYLATIVDDCGFTRVDTFEITIDTTTLSVDLGPDFSICPGQTGLLDPMLPPGLDYLWQNGNTTPTLIAALPGLYWVEVSSTCAVARDSVEVSLETPPFAVFTADPSACAGEAVTYTFAGPTPPATATFNWDFDGGIVQGGSGAGPYQVFWPTPGTYTVSLIIDDNGCLSNVATQTITIHPIPTANFSLDPDACEGQNAQLVYTGSASPSASYLWDLDGGLPAVSGPGPHQVNWSTPGVKTVSLTVEEFGCISPAFTQTITINPTPSAAFALPGSVCEEDSIQIVYQGSSSAAASYAWTFGSGNQIVSGSGQGPYTVRWITPGTKTVCLQVQENGCTSNLLCQDIDVTARPDVDIDAQANQCFDGNSFSFTASGDPADSYFWNFGPSASPPTSTD